MRDGDNEARVEAGVVDPADLSALPSDRPAALRPRFQGACAAAIDADLATFERATGVDVAGVRGCLRGLDVRRPWSPELYFRGGCIIRAFRERSVDAAVDAVAQLRQLLLEGRAYAGPRSVESLLHDPWEHPFARMFAARPSMQHLDVRDRPHLRPILEEPALSGMRSLVGRALALIREVAPRLADEFEALVTAVRLFKIEATRVTFTTLDTHGVVFLGIADGDDAELVDELVEGILHETAHVRLNTLMFVEPLLENEDGELFSFPTRRDRQAMRVVFHAPFVYSRILHVVERLLGRAPNPSRRRRFERVSRSYRTAHAEVAAGARLTPSGQRFFASLGHLHSICAG